MRLQPCSHKIEFSFLNGNLLDDAAEEHQIRQDNPRQAIAADWAATPSVAVSVRRVAMTIGARDEVSTQNPLDIAGAGAVGRHVRTDRHWSRHRSGNRGCSGKKSTGRHPG